MVWRKHRVPEEWIVAVALILVLATAGFGMAVGFVYGW